MVLKELCGLYGVSGNEQAVRKYILNAVKQTADSVTVDRIGNVLAFKKGTQKDAGHVLLCAHMDEAGFIIQGANDDGLLSYLPIGDTDPKYAVSKHVVIGSDHVNGVIGAKAIHLQTPDEYHKVLDHDELFIDIGAHDATSASEKVHPGDYGTFVSEWTEFGNGLIKARAIGDRAGCMILMSLLEGRYAADITCAFTVQSHIEGRGAECVALNQTADRALVIGCSRADDIGAPDEAVTTCRIGGGAALGFMDKRLIGSRNMISELRDIAQTGDISWQYDAGVNGMSEAGAIQRMFSGVRTALIGIPCRNPDTTAAVCSLNDIEAVYMLAEACLGGAEEE